jgi:hypothetical protein
MHRFAAQKLANRRAQHGAAVGAARIRRWARALQLQLPALARRVDCFAQRDRAAVAELPGPVAELVPAVVGRVGLHAVEQRVASEHLCERGRCGLRRGDAQQRRHLARIRNQARRGHRRGPHPRVQRPVHLPPLRSSLEIGGQVAYEAVVEAEGLHSGMSQGTCS